LSSEWLAGGFDKNNLECWTWLSEQPFEIYPKSRYIGVNLGFSLVPAPNVSRRVKITVLFENDEESIKPSNSMGGMTEVYNVELLDFPAEMRDKLIKKMHDDAVRK
jgi:hypothetical protein